MKTLLPLLIVLFVSFGVRAQNAELVLEKGVEARREIDEIYRRFSESYRTLDAEKVINLYTETAAYCSQTTIFCRDVTKVREVFAPFFER
jgi:ketosteroid isomerase-like protein